MGKQQEVLDKAGRAAFFRRDCPVFLLYAVVTAVMTYPAVTLVSRTYAEPRDPLGVLWWFWWLKYSVFGNLPTSPVSMVAAPFGLRVNVFTPDPLHTLLARGMVLISNETITYNILLLLSFFSSAVAAYYLVRYLTGYRWAAAFSGLAFGFCPYMLMQGKEHLSLIATLWLPLFALALIKAWRRRTVGSVVTCGVVFLVLTLFNYQYSMMAGISGVVFIAALLLTGRRSRSTGGSRDLVKKTLPVVVVVAVVVAVLFISMLHSPLGEGKGISSARQYSARPWDYVLPTAQGALLGNLTSGFITSHLHGSFLAENSLFLGYLPLALSFLALIFALRRRRWALLEPHGTGGGACDTAGHGTPPPLTGSDTRRIILAFAACGLVAFVLSMPPTVTFLGIKVYLPSYLLFKAVPQFRAFARFGVIVMLSVSVLAGYGIAVLARKRWFSGRHRLMVAGLLVLIILEFTIIPPFHSLDTRATTDYYRWLKDKPGQQVVAMYPMYYRDDFFNYGYLFQQRMHHKTLVNGADDTEGERYRQVLLDLEHPATPGLLKDLGTDYVMVIPGLFSSLSGWHMNYVFPTVVDESEYPPGLEPVRKFPDCLVYEVTAAPAEFIPLFTEGTFQAYIDPRGRFWHPGARTVVIRIESRLRGSVTCDLRFEAMTPRSEGVITATLNGEDTGGFPVEPSPVEIEISDVELHPGENTLVLESDAPLAYLTEVPGYREVEAAVMLGNVLVVNKQ